MKDSAEEFLAHHDDPREPPILSDGQIVGDWRIVAFLGRGGSGEVYRVVETQGAWEGRAPARPQAAALKILARDTATARARFLREASLLAHTDNPASPHFIAQGETDGRPYLVMELLEPRVLPSSDVEVADFLLNLCEGVGTPGYAASEQLMGDTLSPAADIHALGMLANTCFGGQPPPVWGRIIDRATGSIPARRYPDVAAFARAIRHRHWRRNISIAGALLCAAIGIATCGRAVAPRPPSEGSRAVRERDAWAALCTDVVTNRISQVVVGIESAVTNETPFNPRLLSVTPLFYRCRPETNAVKATIIRLDGRTNVFERVIRLDPAREYRIVGPGMLDAVLTGPANRDSRWRAKTTAKAMRTEKDAVTGRTYAIGGLSPGEIVDDVPSNGVVRLENCVVRNRAGARWPANGIYYVLERGARLELPNIEESLDFRRGDFVAVPAPEAGTVLFGEAARRP